MVLLEVVKKNQRMVALSLFLGITIAFLDNFSIGYFEQLVNQFATDDLDVRTILIYGSVLTLVCLLKYGQEYPDGKLSNGLYLDFKVGALDKISRIDYAEYQNLGTGLVIQKIENGATAGKSIIFNFYLTVLKELFPAILFSLVFIYRINKPITYLLLIGYVFVFMASHLLLTFLYKMKNHVLLNEERFNSRLVRGLTEVVVFRLNRQYPNELKLLRRYQKEIVASKTKMTLIHEAFFTLFALFIIIIKLMILVFAWQSQTISVGAVIALLGLVDNAYQPVAIFNVLFVQFKLDELAYERYNNLIHLPQDPHLSTGKNCRLTDEELRFTNVGFSYGQRTILSNLTLSIAPGEHIALVGASGSGKSTVLKLLIGLLKPTEGDIWLGSQPLSEVCLDRYYENVVYVSQESPLFMGSLRENIVFGHDVDDELILEALKAVCLIDWYKKLPQGLNTNIGEKGITLSGGERQRLVLARLWFQRCTLVILDEATSAIDTLTERDVLENIRALLVNQTVITITHRLHGIDAKERTLVFKEGQVIADGQFGILKQTSPYLQLLIQTSNQEQ